MSNEHSRNPVVVAGGVAVLALVASVGTVFLLGGDVEAVLWALVLGIVAGGSIVGAYLLGRRFGQPHSHAVAQAGIILGVFLVAAVVAELLHDAGQLSNGTIGVGLGGAVLATLVVIGLVVALDRGTAA